MKAFAVLQVAEAVQHAAEGGQALHLHRVVPDRAKAPRCFVAAVDRGECIAHLFDRDRERLIRTARKCGVRVIHIDRDGTDRQHIDLCGAPLKKCLMLVEDQERLREIIGGAHILHIDTVRAAQKKWQQSLPLTSEPSSD